MPLLCPKNRTAWTVLTGQHWTPKGASSPSKPESGLGQSRRLGADQGADPLGGSGCTATAAPQYYPSSALQPNEDRWAKTYWARARRWKPSSTSPAIQVWLLGQPQAVRQWPGLVLIPGENPVPHTGQDRQHFLPLRGRGTEAQGCQSVKATVPSLWESGVLEPVICAGSRGPGVGAGFTVHLCSTPTDAFEQHHSLDLSFHPCSWPQYHFCGCQL